MPGRPASTFILLVSLLAGCSSTTTVNDPVAALSDPASGYRVHLAAMDVIDASPPPDEAELQALHRAVWKAGYTPETREAAARRLLQHDPEGLKRTLRQQLPRMTAWEGIERLSELIVEQGWTDLTPALVSSWARRAFFEEEADRPEYKALVALHGRDNVEEVVFDLLLTSRKVSEQGLRTRCWDLLHRLGRRPALVDLLRSADVPEDDLFMLDLRAAARDLGMVPWNREEILWLRKLRQPEHSDFWSEARGAVEQVPPSRREELELRDIPVLVSVVRHEPALLSMRKQEMYARLDSILEPHRHYSHGGNFDNLNARRRERLYNWRNELSWGDLAAMLIARRALEVPEVVDHLFDYAERDRHDTTTEYGGVVQLDRLGRFEILEFPPRVRYDDVSFISSQEMMDAAYQALFHFHFHAQKHHNRDYAGPGFGDMNYAENVRANCLVLTFVSEDRMNVDFYRHGRVLIDLGEVRRR